MEIKKIKKAIKKPINSKLQNLEEIKKSIKKNIENYEQITAEIRNGFEEVVVVFIDLVDSTKYKIENKDNPEIWISRIRLFSEILKKFIQDCNGKVVKYIGDEVMAVFDRESQINDAINFVQRIKDIEETLTDMTETTSNIKIALDYGKVFLLEYDGHNELDPQGTPIDRCARIAKYCKSTTVLTSYEFVAKTEFPDHWKKIGESDFKGLGVTDIYQYGKKTVHIEPLIEVYKSKYIQMEKESKENSLEITQLKSMNKKLKEQFDNIEEKVEKDFIHVEENEDDEKDELWREIEEDIGNIRSTIRKSNVPENEYARFLFLYMRGEGDRYDKFEGREFDSSIEEDIVSEEGNGSYSLNSFNRRNVKLIKYLESLQTNLGDYELKYRSEDEEDEEELFDYSLESSEFWENYFNYNVR